MTDIEGEADDGGEINEDEASEDELSDAFETLLVNTNDVKERSSSSWFTLIENLLAELVIMTDTANTHEKGLINDLNSLSLIHQLTGENPILKLNEVKDVYTFTIEGKSRYDSYHFYGIVIDTRVSKYSIAGFNQFQALKRTN